MNTPEPLDLALYESMSHAAAMAADLEGAALPQEAVRWTDEFAALGIPKTTVNPP